jgi:hypothetical protein
MNLFTGIFGPGSINLTTHHQFRMNPNNCNSVSVNSDRIFQQEPEFQKVKTLSKISMISRGGYRPFSYLGQQWDKMERLILLLNGVRDILNN